jgi:hypothetical protein
MEKNMSEESKVQQEIVNADSLNTDETILASRRAFLLDTLTKINQTIIMKPNEILWLVSLISFRTHMQYDRVINATGMDCIINPEITMEEISTSIIQVALEDVAKTQNLEQDEYISCILVAPFEYLKDLSVEKLNALYLFGMRSALANYRKAVIEEKGINGVENPQPEVLVELPTKDVEGNEFLVKFDPTKIN